MYYSVSVPKQLSTQAGSPEDNVFQIVVDTEGDKVEFRSTDGKSVISLDLVCAAEVEDTLHQLTGSKIFQAALAKNRAEHLSRLNPANSARY